ncbi:cation:proton antiporter regulatory subunit [Halopelagius fulvigenes]|uniref:Cation:proton antiporter regulatory subunit n=1 Tax=Halopelagius fulvigenes TaxID=1198324 RepID=A0ABD5U2E1_9EURY
MTVYESDLPGVGKKHEVDLDDGGRLVIVTHNTGRREVFLRPDPDSDSEKLFELSDQLARQVGTLLEGAYFQPVQMQEIETRLGDGTVLNWVEVGADSPVAGKTLAESDFRNETGASVIAVERDEEVFASPGGDTRIRAGDTLVIIGRKDACEELEAYVEDE